MLSYTFGDLVTYFALAPEEMLFQTGSVSFVL